MDCYDGNQYVEQNTKFGKVMDLSIPQNLGKQFDWVQSFEVGEYIPPKKTDIFVHNIASHARKGIILSWGLPNQGGFNHINGKKSSEVKEMFEKLGFKENK